MKVIVVAGGNYDEDLVRSLINDTEEDVYLIGADRGALSLILSGYKIDIAVGDFDSVTDEERETINTYSREVISLKPEKDATDMECAVKNAIDKCRRSEDHFNYIYLFAATGTRMDHTLANIEMLFFIKSYSRNIKTLIIDGHNRIRLLDNNEYHVFYKDQLIGKYVSFLPFGEDVDHLTLKGFKYEVKNTILCLGTSRGVSNEVKDDVMSVFFETGSLLMIESRD